MPVGKCFVTFRRGVEPLVYLAVVDTIEDGRAVCDGHMFTMVFPLDIVWTANATKEGGEVVKLVRLGWVDEMVYCTYTMQMIWGDPTPVPLPAPESALSKLLLEKLAMLDESGSMAHPV
jgi:hypothetical protein